MPLDDWSIILTDVDGVPLADLTAEAQDIKLTFRLRGQHEATWTVDGHSQLARATQELLCDVVIVWRSMRLARLRVTQSSDDIGAEGHTVTFAAIDYRGMMARRFTRGGQTLTGDVATLVWDLIYWTQTQSTPAGGDWGITLGTKPAISNVTAYPVPAARPFKELFEELAEQTYPGFDWEIDADLRYQVWTFRGTQRPFALEWGGNVINVKRDVDPSLYTNYVRQSGADGVASAYRGVADLAARAEGRIEAAEGNPDLATAAQVGNAADAYLTRHSTLLPGYALSLEPGSWDPVQFWLGDMAPLVVRSGRLDVHSIERVFEIAVDIDANGEQAVELTFGDLREDLLALVRKLPPRLDRLYRN